MKLHWMPTVASLCCAFFCASMAQANSVYVHNKPLKNVVTINNTVYVPFAELMKSLKRSWTIDEKGNVNLRDFGNGGPAIASPDFLLQGGKRKASVHGVVRDGQVWVPVRVAKEVGYELVYNAQTEIVDIMSPRLISDADRAAQAEVEAAREAREAALAEQKAAEQAALAERKQALAELKAKKAGKGEETKEATSAEGAYDPDFEAEQKAAARRVRATQKNIGEVSSYSDLMRVQEQLDAENAARRSAYYDAKDAVKAAKGEKTEAKEKAAPEPTPNVVVLAPRATPDWFTGHITMTANIKNVGTATANGLTATVSLIDPSGAVLTTQRVSRGSVSANGEWNISLGYDHMAGAEIPRGNYQLRVNVDYANKPAKK